MHIPTKLLGSQSAVNGRGILGAPTTAPEAAEDHRHTQHLPHGDPTERETAELGIRQAHTFDWNMADATPVGRGRRLAARPGRRLYRFDAGSGPTRHNVPALRRYQSLGLRARTFGA